MVPTHSILGVAVLQVHYIARAVTTRGGSHQSTHGANAFVVSIVRVHRELPWLVLD